MRVSCFLLRKRLRTEGEMLCAVNGHIQTFLTNFCELHKKENV